MRQQDLYGRVSIKTHVVSFSSLALTLFLFERKYIPMTSSTTIASFVYPTLTFSYRLRFWLHFIPNILSILCSIFALYHFLFNRQLRHAINNHVIIILIILGLFYELTDITWITHWYYFQHTLIETPAFAIAWTYIDYTIFNCQTMLFAWATIERHILVFHDRWVSTKRKRFFVHYLPIIGILTYCFCYYSIIYLAPFCTNTYDFNKMYGLAAVHCIYKNPVIPKYNIISNGIIPTLIIIIFSLGLILRVLLQQARLRRSINWRKQRKMIVQLISISLIYLILYAPYILLYLAYNLGLSRSVGAAFTVYLIFFVYYITFLFPFVASLTLPQLRVKIKNLFFCRCRRYRTPTVRPTYN